MTRKEIRPNRARTIGNILPVYSEMMEECQYEVFNCKQEENGSTIFKDIQSTTRNLYTLNRGTYYISNIDNWISEHPREGTNLVGNNLRHAFIDDNDYANMGRGYLTVYKTPVIYDITNPLNPTMFIYDIDLTYDSNYAYALLGFLNNAENNVNPGISKKLDNLVTYNKLSETEHNLQYKLKGGIVYMFVDNMYTGQYLDVRNKTKDLMVAFYMGSASSNYEGIVIREMSMEKMNSIYPANYLTGNIDVWVTDKKKNGSSVADEAVVEPFVNTETGRINAGRGNCVYLKKAIINQYNQELLDAFTLTADVSWDENSGQEILFGELNQEGTDIIGAFKKGLNIVNDPVDVTDTCKVQWKCRNSHAHLFINEKYTGVNRTLSSGTDYSFGIYNSRDISSVNFDGVEVSGLKIENTCNLYPFTYQILNLNNWNYQQYTGSSATTTQDPSLVNNTVDVGGANYTYLNAPLMIEDNVDYVITLTYTGNYQRIGLGSITTVSGKIRPTGIDQALTSFLNNTTIPHEITYKTFEGVAYLYVDGEYADISYDFTGEQNNIYMGFYDNNTSTGIRVQNIDAINGTLTDDTIP